MKSCSAHPLDSGCESLATLQQKWEKGGVGCKELVKEEAFYLSQDPAVVSSPYKPSKPASWVRKPSFLMKKIFSILFAESVLIFPFNVLIMRTFAMRSKGGEHSHIKFPLAGSQSCYFSKMMKI